MVQGAQVEEDGDNYVGEGIATEKGEREQKQVFDAEAAFLHRRLEVDTTMTRILIRKAHHVRVFEKSVNVWRK